MLNWVDLHTPQVGVYERNDVKCLNKQYLFECS